MIKIFQVGSTGEAQYRVHITDQKLTADLFVCLTTSPAMATGNGNWYVTKNFTEANRKVVFCGKGAAQFSVYFVKSRAEAGWQKANRFQREF